jgi:hypothetical protein
MHLRKPMMRDIAVHNIAGRFVNMKVINRNIEIGTLVKVEGGFDEWHKVIAFQNDRKILRVEDMAGYFQEGHILKYTNYIHTKSD